MNRIHHDIFKQKEKIKNNNLKNFGIENTTDRFIYPISSTTAALTHLEDQRKSAFKFYNFDNVKMN